jgi:hypothetical protein
MDPAQQLVPAVLSPAEQAENLSFRIQYSFPEFRHLLDMPVTSLLLSTVLQQMIYTYATTQRHR